MKQPLPSAVSIMLERLCTRLIPRTTALEGRSTRGPLDGGATAVTSGKGALFSGGAVETTCEQGHYMMPSQVLDLGCLIV